MFQMLDWRLVGRGLDNPQLLARDQRGNVLAINRVKLNDGPDRWCLSGEGYGLASFHASETEAKAAAQHWADTGERVDRDPGRL